MWDNSHVDENVLCVLDREEDRMVDYVLVGRKDCSVEKEFSARDNE